MSDSLTDLILSLTPEDGSSIGNGAMMALLRERVPGLADDDYFAARDALVDEGFSPAAVGGAGRSCGWRAIRRTRTTTRSLGRGRATTRWTGSN